MNAPRIVLAALACAGAAVLLTPATSRAGIVTYHQFANTGGAESFDTSGNAQTGIVKETVLLPGVGGGRFTGGTGGAFGGALYFDDPYGDSTFAQFTSDFDISAAGSISFFVEHDYVGYRQAYLRGGGSDLSVEMHSGSTVFSSMPGGDTFFGTGAQMYASGTWRHIVVTWDASNSNSQRLYVDGVLQREANNCCGVDGLGSTFLDTVFTVGQRRPQGSAATTRNLDGGIDDLAFYDHQLSETDIDTIGMFGAAAVSSGQVVHWNFDDPIGTDTATSNGGSSSINMLVGGGGGIVEVGPDLHAAAGPMIGALTLDAASFDNTLPSSPSANTRITIPDSPVMDFDKTQGTVVMWINKSSTGYGETYLGTDDSTAEILLRSSNSGRTIMRVNGDAVYETDSGVSLLNQTDEWHHLGFTWNATTGAHTIYIDATVPAQSLVEGSAGPWDPVPVSDTGDWTIGFDIADRPFSGLIADFAIFDEELTATDIQEIMDIGVEEFIACGVMTGTRLQLGKINVEPNTGNDSLKFQGEYVPPGILFPQMDPSVNGARIRIETTDGTPRVDVLLPPGERQGPYGSGWDRGISGRRWVFKSRDNDPSLNGIKKFKLKDIRRPDPDRVGVKIVGQRGTYPVIEGDEPLRVIVAIDDTVVGECGEVEYLPEECAYRNRDKELRCESPETP